MKKIEKWLVCQNDMLESPGSYLLHTRNPRFLIQISDLDLNSSPDPHKLVESLVYINPESLPELYELEIIHQYEESDKKKLKKQLHLAVKWYREYLKWEDGGGTGFISDFNEQCPGLKIIRSDDANKWLTIYKGQTHVFENEILMDQYLIDLGFTEPQIEKGQVVIIK